MAGSVKRRNLWMETNHCSLQTEGARNSVVGRGTKLQSSRLRVPFPKMSMDFSIYLAFPPALLSWVLLSFYLK
jgi:hypothetical protein